jgi:hypothetical protein
MTTAPVSADSYFLFDAPRRLCEVWEWFSAFYAFDFGDRQPLATLIRAGKEVPPEFRSAVADVISGDRKPNLKRAAKVKVPPGEAVRVACSVEGIAMLCEKFRAAPAWSGDGRHRTRLEEVADDRGTEPIQELRALQAVARDTVETAAQQFNVSIETIENLMREVRRRVEAWPVV